MCYHQDMRPPAHDHINASRWRILWPVLRQLGWQQASLFALYQLGLRSGHYRRLCDPEKAIRQASGMDPLTPSPLWHFPAPDDLQAVLGEIGQARLLAEADEIVAGQVRLFGGPPVALELVTPGPLAHWTACGGGETSAGESAQGDIKWTWEPGRLGWAYTLGRAYWISRDERYAAAMWDKIETFLEANPAYQGPQWMSAQEVALRLVALTFCWQALQTAGDAYTQKALRLGQAVAVHAQRIPPTLVYARAQNNNHLLSEAAGLYTAGLFLPTHPAAARWRSLGWRWFNQGILAQVAPDGAYVQHSTSYHRLMLQTALWVSRLAGSQGQALPENTRQRLAAATRWLLALLDSGSGRVPNLGPNDGAYILPLTVQPHADYRPVLQAAAITFLGQRLFADGAWDEMALWLSGSQATMTNPDPANWKQRRPDQTPHVLRASDGESWAYLRAARFTGRPGHADQLHFDLWWRGLNVTQDAGTYLYNAPPPWENALTHSDVHNTVVIDERDQMRRAGRFLYIDWAQAEVLNSNEAQDSSQPTLSARHNGYRRLGLWHQRDVSAGAAGDWQIRDRIYPMQTPGPDQLQTASLHWLLPDWPWEVQTAPGSTEIAIRVMSPFGPVQLRITAEPLAAGALSAGLQVARAGELLYGIGPVLPTWGWCSPAYGLKIPALSLRLTVTNRLPIHFTTQITFPSGARTEKFTPGA